MKKAIIFIDDEIDQIKNTYVLACQWSLKEYDTVTFTQPEMAEKYLKTYSDNVAIIIVDIMFAGDGEYKGGYDRGITFCKDILMKEYENIPFFILTNLNNDKKDRLLRDHKDINEENYLLKIEITPKELVSKIKEYLKK